MADEFDVPDMPSWILSSSMELVIGSDLHVGCKGSVEILEEARGVVPRLAALERTLLARLEGHDSAQSPTAQSSYDSQCVHTVCLARLLLGACCEAFVALRSSEIARPGTRPKAIGTCQQMARLYKDSCHAAVWTSAHAHYIHDLLTYGITVNGPSLYSSANELVELDLSELYSHRFSSRRSDSSASSASNSLLSLMTRCTNPGSRGWDGILSTMLDENTGTKRICCNALMISLTGMNSCIHPAWRLHWKRRLALSLHLGCNGLFNQMLPLCNHPTAFKECVRRMVSNTTSSAYASNSALAHLEHPVALLSSAPFKLPIDGLECSSTAFANAGRKIYESRGSTSIQDAIKHAFATLNSASSEEAQIGVLQWNPGYLGARHSNYTFPFPVPHYTTQATGTVYHLLQPLLSACFGRQGHGEHTPQGSRNFGGCVGVVHGIQVQLHPVLVPQRVAQPESGQAGPPPVRSHSRNERGDQSHSASHRLRAYGNTEACAPPAVFRFDDSGRGVKVAWHKQRQGVVVQWWFKRGHRFDTNTR